MRDVDCYVPTFFMHNLLTSFPVLSMSYAVTTSVHNIRARMRYADEIAANAQQLRENVSTFIGGIAYGAFCGHVRDCLRGAWGRPPCYLPHAMCDVISVGAMFGDKEYFRNGVDVAGKRIAMLPPEAQRIIGDVDTWKACVRGVIDASPMSTIDRNALSIGLPKMPVYEMTYAHPRVPPWDFLAF
jgi:hypothetical protein